MDFLISILAAVFTLVAFGVAQLVLKFSKEQLKFLSNPSWQALGAIVSVIAGAISIFAIRQTILPEVVVTPTVQVSIPIAASAFPCDAQIVNHSLALLYVIHSSPSSEASQTEPIQQGSKVSILARLESAGLVVWYQIATVDGSELGWVLSQYVVPGTSCPIPQIGQTGSGIHISKYCQEVQGMSLPQVEANEWRCTDETGNVKKIDIEDVCIWQFGQLAPYAVQARPDDPYSWYCSSVSPTPIPFRSNKP